MLTPKELSRIEFEKVFRGYSPEAVDAFLARVIAEYEAVCHEHALLKAQLAERDAERARATDTAAIDQLLDAARSSAEHLAAAAREEAEAVRFNAKAEAEATIAEANARAGELLRAAQGRIDALERDRERLALEEVRLRRQAELLFQACDEFLSSAGAAASAQVAEAAAADDQAEKD